MLTFSRRQNSRASNVTTKQNVRSRAWKGVLAGTAPSFLLFCYFLLFRYLRPFLFGAWGIGVVCCLLDYGLIDRLRMRVFAGIPSFLLEVSLRRWCLGFASDLGIRKRVKSQLIFFLRSQPDCVLYMTCFDDSSLFASPHPLLPLAEPTIRRLFRFLLFSIADHPNTIVSEKKKKIQ